jgi:hypothetical protein
MALIDRCVRLENDSFVAISAIEEAANQNGLLKLAALPPAISGRQRDGRS